MQEYYALEALRRNLAVKGTTHGQRKKQPPPRLLEASSKMSELTTDYRLQITK